MVKVFGHYSPDTDATCSAIAWAWYLNEHTDYEATPYVLGAINKETSFVLKHFDQTTPEVLDTLTKEDTVAVVDTNNPQELPENINEAKIISVIDHHKLVGGLATEAPVTITMRPVAATATIIHDLLTAEGTDLPPAIKGILLAAIISDTLEFRSPTTTDHDQAVATSLAKSLDLDLTTFANQMFAAKSDISDISDAELLTLDSKKFALGDKNVRVSVIETTDPKTVLARQASLVEAITNTVDQEAEVDEILLFVIDILEETATVLTYNDLTKQIISASFAVKNPGDTVVLPGIVSRKKQILPALQL